MSYDIPLKIQAEIIKRLPVKSVIKTQSFANTVPYTHVQHVLVRYIDSSHFDFIADHIESDFIGETSSKYEYVSIVDDDTFPQRKVSIKVPSLVTMLRDHNVVGSSYGLLCLYGRDYDRPYAANRRVVLWNPLLEKAVAVVVRNVSNDMIYGNVIGFGVCRATTDPKIVKITYFNLSEDMQRIKSIPWQVEVFTLSTGAWRQPCCNPPRTSIAFIPTKQSVDVDGVIYWLATDNRINRDGKSKLAYNLIISFDMTTEEFREVNLPDTLAYQSPYNLSLHKLKASLVVLEHGIEAVWTMEDGAPKSFTKLITVDRPIASKDAYPYVLGFRKTGEPIIEIKENLYSHNRTRELRVYEPYSKQVNNLGIKGVRNSFSVFSNTKSPLLLDQPNFKIYDKF